MVTNFGQDFKGKPLGKNSNYYDCSFIYQSKFYKKAFALKDALNILLEDGSWKKIPYDKVRLYKLDEYQNKHLKKIVQDRKWKK